VIDWDQVQQDHEPALSETGAWQLLLLLARRASTAPSCAHSGFSWFEGEWVPDEPDRAWVRVDGERSRVLCRETPSPSANLLFDLYLPLVVGRHCRNLTVGHLGQSLDARVATPTGASQFITSREDIVHTHRLRALFDAVVVGANTVQADNPRLTTRLVPGDNPTRVVLDPSCRLDRRFNVFSDGEAPTLVCTADAKPPSPTGTVQWMTVPAHGGQFEAGALIDALRRRGLCRLFIEGGGVTVSHFLAARRLHRLHVSVAPVILGSGAPSVALPPIDQLEEAMRFHCRHFSLGPDLLFDCELDSCCDDDA